MIEVNDKRRCSGCTACASICPQNCIHMKYDSEGFYYPEVNNKLCINCNLCENVCPYIKEQTNRSDKMTVYGCQNNEESIRKISTSGGMFAAIAEYILTMDGVVFGAGYDSQMHVIHKSAESIDQIRELQGSKYVQSELCDTFSIVKEYLKSGKYVFFTGTPCQVEGLLYFLNGINTDNLVTADVKCYGVPSSELFDIFQEYLSELYGSKVKNFYFRDKKYGYAGVNIKAVLKNGKIIEDKLTIKSYSKTMFSKVGLRRSCYECVFTTRKKLSDFTLGDIWTIEDYDKNMDDDKGTTCVEVNSLKGEKIFKEIECKGAIRTVKISELEGDRLFKYQKNLQRHYDINEDRRNAFFKDMREMPYPQLMNKHFPNSAKNIIDNIAKPILRLIPGASVVFRLRKKKRAGKVCYLK